MKSNKQIIIIISILASFVSGAQENNAVPVMDPSGIMEQVNLFAGKTNSIVCEFRQEKEMSFMEETVVSGGKFYFQKEKLLRWEYTEPFRYAIVLNNSRIRIIDEGKNKDFDAGSNRMFIEISDIMSGMVNGTLLNSEQP